MSSRVSGVPNSSSLAGPFLCRKLFLPSLPPPKLSGKKEDASLLVRESKGQDFHPGGYTYVAETRGCHAHTVACRERGRSTSRRPNLRRGRRLLTGQQPERRLELRVLLDSDS